MSELPALYARVSSEEQAKEGFSIPSQIEKCTSKCREKGLPAPKEFVDPGFSGSEVTRPAFNQLKSAIISGEVGLVFIWRLDRLTRRQKELLEFIELLKEHRVDLISLNELIDTDSAAGLLQLNVMGSINEYYLGLQTENIIAGLERRASQGLWNSTPPTGYDLVDGMLVPNEMSAAVTNAFRLVEDGKTMNDAAKLTGINASTLRGVLVNRAYIGLVPDHKGGFVSGQHVPLVDEDTFNTVHQIRNQGTEKFKKRSRYALSRFMTCSYCGRRATICANGRGEHFFRCRHNSGSACAGFGHKAITTLEKCLMRAFDLIKENGKLVDDMRDYLRTTKEHIADKAATSSRDFVKQETAIKRRKGRILEAYEAEAMTLEDFKAENTKLDDQLLAITKEKSVIDNLDKEYCRAMKDIEDLVIGFSELPFSAIWSMGNLEEQKKILQGYVEEILLYREHMEVKFFGLPPFNIWYEEVKKTPRRLNMERETGLEPATWSLEGSRSTN